MNKSLMLALAMLILLGASGCGYNTSIALQEKVEAQWAQVDVQLKRRFDLIPNLIETVKGYATHEKEIFTSLAEARKGYFAAGTRDEKIKYATQMESSLSRLLMFKETYPALKADESFRKLQDTLEGTENRISVERNRYNDAVRELNTYIRGIPGQWWASMAGVKGAEYFKVDEAEKAVPKVKF